jgi:hypothetical protein
VLTLDKLALLALLVVGLDFNVLQEHVLGAVLFEILVKAVALQKKEQSQEDHHGQNGLPIGKHEIDHAVDYNNEEVFNVSFDVQPVVKTFIGHL